MRSKKLLYGQDYVGYHTDGLLSQQPGPEAESIEAAISAQTVKKSSISETVKATSSFTQTTLTPLSTQHKALSGGEFLSNDFYAAQVVSSSFAPPVTQSKQPLSDNDAVKKPKHYTQGIETWNYILSHGLGYLEGNIVKYITRYRLKNGREDLLKAQAYLNKLLEETK